VGNSQNFIEINGKKYDAVTGVMYTGSSPSPVSRPVVDGFVRRPKDTSSVRSSLHSAKKHTVTPQKSKTLMRAAVKKPVHIVPKSEISAKPAAKTLYGKATITPRTHAVPSHRQKIASTTQKSAYVQKFGAPAIPTAKVAPLEVRTAPPHIDVSKAPVAAPINNLHAKKSDLLDRALEAAQGHKEPFYEHKKSWRTRVAKKIGVSGRAIAISTTVLSGLVLGGLYAYQNVPKLAMRVAASRAGFNASMPSYSPAGFSFSGPVQYSSGQVVVGFKSNTDDRQYKLTQQTSNWSSDSLLSNFITNNNKQYQTYQDRGRTIYIYDDTNATWVDGGIWYQIEGKSQLTSDQLVRIAASL
jgi:hypothetical protein